MLLKFLSAMSQTSLGGPASEKSTHVEEAIMESRYKPTQHRVGMSVQFGGVSSQGSHVTDKGWDWHCSFPTVCLLVTAHKLPFSARGL